MKRTLLIALLLLPCFASFAQKIHFTDKSNTWNILVTYDNSGTILNQMSMYSYMGSEWIDSVEYQILGPYYVREDIAANKVYIRYHDVNHSLIDSTDRLLYDYNWKENDTITSHQFFGDYVSWVSYIDSTKIDGYWYKIWHFTGGKDSGNGHIYYNVIEGIGCTNRFDYPVNTPLPDGSNQLVCFTNNGVGPDLNIPVVSYGMFFLNTLDFDNVANCPLSAAEITSKISGARLYPNPVTEQSKIVLPYTISNGNFTILNYMGQTVVSTTFEYKSEIPVWEMISTPGIYMYQVTDNSTGKVYTGKFTY